MTNDTAFHMKQGEASEASEADDTAPVGQRTGPALIKVTAAFAEEQRWKTWLLFIETVAVMAGLVTLVVVSSSLLVQIMTGVLLGFIQVRLFIFYHDAMHGALFRKDPLGQVVMSVVGYYFLAVRSTWTETHDYHHRNNAKLVGSAIGSYPVLSVKMLSHVSPSQWRMYKLIRHPMVMVTGLVSIFMIGMVGSAFARSPRTHWQGLLAVILYLGITVLLVVTCGWAIGLCVMTIPHVVGMMLGSYLFYAQHNFPEIKLMKRHGWTYTKAALQSSSMFDMSPIMHWLTGNIGYHHVHHLNHRIPFYNLPAAMAAIPELQHPGRTTWRLRDIRACLNLAAWDQSQDRMITYAEAEAVRAQGPKASAA